MKRARHKKEKHAESQAQATSAEHHESGSGDGVQPTVLEVDSREGEICYNPRKSFHFQWTILEWPSLLCRPQQFCLNFLV